MRYLPLALIVLLCSCGGSNDQQAASKDTSITVRPAADSTAYASPDSLPQPFASKSAERYSNVVGWPAGRTPTAPAGFMVEKFAEGLRNPRNIYIADNGDIFVSEANTGVSGVKKVAADLTGKGKSQNLGQSANDILLFREAPGQGYKKYTYLKGLKQPYGILVLGNHFYVANTDGLMQYDYNPSDSFVQSMGKQIVSLPAGGYNNHWTRQLAANADKSKIFISVGSGSNVAEHGIEHEKRRADILEINPDGTGEKIFASGLRNPAGLSLQPQDHTLWAAVNERDELGDDLVPDYVTSVHEGDFFGWPWTYFGDHPDPRLKDSASKAPAKARVPDIPVGSHTASLGLCFYTGQSFPAKYRNGAFVGQHGSWNRSQFSGYKVTFIPFRNGKPSGKMEDFLTGFIADTDKGTVYGRPVGIAVLKNGSLLIADDASNTIWLVRPS